MAIVKDEKAKAAWIKAKKKKKRLSGKIPKPIRKYRKVKKKVKKAIYGAYKKVKSGVKAVGKELLSPDDTPKVKKKVYKTEQEYIEHRDMMRRGDKQYEGGRGLNTWEKKPYAEAKAKEKAEEKAFKLRYDKKNKKK